MKTILKVLAWCFLFFILLGVGCAALFDTAVKESDKVEVKTNETGKTKKVEKSSLLTKENYDKINQGDVLTGEGGSSKDEVISLLGEPETKSESSFDDVTHEYLNWHSLKSGVSISVTISNGKVSNKTFAKL